MMQVRGELDTLFPRLAELAMQSSDRQTFRHHWLSLLTQWLSVDSADVISTGDGVDFATYTVNADKLPLAQGAPRYFGEMAMSELLLLTKGRTLLDDTIFCERRREQLRAYRELLNPRGVVRNAMRCWARKGSLVFIVLCKHRGTRPFSDDDLRAVDRLAPILSLGEALHAGSEGKPTPRSIAEFGVSEAEAKVVSLAQRGLTNQEISAITGTKPPTVRNQLSAAYRKLGVSNRTELSFLLSDMDWTPRRPSLKPDTAIVRFLENERALLRSSAS